MNKKGAIELSMTTIIVIVIGVVLLSLGLVWVRGTFSQVTSLTQQAFIQADQEIREKMGGDSKFYISGQTFDLKVKSKITINVGIQNTEGTDASFTLKAEQSGATVTPALIFKIPGAQSIKSGDKKGIPISLEIPSTATPGTTYLYKISALKDTTEYASEVIVINIVA